MIVRFKKDSPPKIDLDEEEIKKLAEIYRDITDMRQSFEEYVENYKKTETEKFLNSKKEK